MATIRQKIAVQKLAEILRKSKGQKNVTMGKLLRAAGYSDDVSKHPTMVTETKGFKELINDYAPDSRIADRLSQLLNSAVIDDYRMDARMTNKEIEEVVESIPGCKVRKINRYEGDAYVNVLFWRPDNMAADKAIDKLIKIKGYYAPVKQEVEGQVTTVQVIKYGSKE